MLRQMTTYASMDLIPLVDEEFDRIGLLPTSIRPEIVASVVLGDDLAWEDQLDSGAEISL